MSDETVEKLGDLGQRHGEGTRVLQESGKRSEIHSPDDGKACSGGCRSGVEHVAQIAHNRHQDHGKRIGSR